MVSKSVKQFAIVSGDSAQSFTEALNDKLIELQDKDVKIEFYENFLGARISWTEKIGQIPECIQDEYELLGVEFECRQCPMFSALTKADGTPDERSRFGRCSGRDRAKVPANRRACEKLYQMIMNEEVQLCLAD